MSLTLTGVRWTSPGGGLHEGEIRRQGQDWIPVSMP
jgi:hypothetical protein